MRGPDSDVPDDCFMFIAGFSLFAGMRQLGKKRKKNTVQPVGYISEAGSPPLHVMVHTGLRTNHLATGQLEPPAVPRFPTPSTPHVFSRLVALQHGISQFVSALGDNTLRIFASLASSATSPCQNAVGGLDLSTASVQGVVCVTGCRSPRTPIRLG